jgi:hypothetical protein
MVKQKYEYKVAIYREPLLGSILLQGSKVDPLKYSEFLNKNAIHGWEVVSMERERRRALIFFSREAFLTIMKRAVGETTAAETA